MGCDIHIVLEREDGGKWIGVHNFPWYHAIGNSYQFPLCTNRNYSLFAALAGVRGVGPAPKGIPSDASELVRMLEKDWESYGHSWTYLNMREAANLFMEHARFDELSEHHRKYPISYFFGIEEREVSHHRLVFFFDN